MNVKLSHTTLRKLSLNILKYNFKKMFQSTHFIEQIDLGWNLNRAFEKKNSNHFNFHCFMLIRNGNGELNKV